MPRALTNKQLAVLAELRQHPQGISAQRLADCIREQTPCPHCGPRDEPGRDRESDCRTCYGWGFVSFDYGTAYQALQRLICEGLATRDDVRDSWGDPVGRHVYFPAARPDSDDPLERAFAAPSAEVDR